MERISRNYREGMEPPGDHPVSKEEIEEDFDVAVWRRNFQQWNRQSAKARAKRKAILMTLLPVVLAIMCYFAWSITINHVNNVREEAGLQPVRIW